MNKSKKMAILAFISITTLFIVFSLVIPNTLRSRESEMKRFLSDMGYQKSKIIDVSGWRSQVTFSTNKGVVNVVLVSNGGLSIKY